MKIRNIRKDYTLSKLELTQMHENPVMQFTEWLNEALEKKVEEPTAMALSTVGTKGFPESRIVLLKGFDENGFVFFTNYLSSKGLSIEENPKAALLFFWPQLEKQVRITGVAQKTTGEISDSYFKSRPLFSQIAVLASKQSTVVASREFIDSAFEKLKYEYENKSPERPDYWGGYIVKAVEFEFWQGRSNRLHDRIVYKKTGNSWEKLRLSP